MSGILGAASIPFIGCVSLLIAMVLQILSFASPHWAEKDDKDFGLWKWTKCEPLDRSINGDSHQEGCFSWEQTWDVSAWLEAVRGLESLTIIFWSFPLVIVPVYIYVALGLKYRSLMGTMTLFILIGAVCNIAGVIVFAVKLDEESDTMDVGWCLIVCGIAFVPGFIAFIVFLIATFKKPKFVPERHFMSGFYVDPDKNRMYVVETVDPTPSQIGTKSGINNPVMTVQ